VRSRDIEALTAHAGFLARRPGRREPCDCYHAGSRDAPRPPRAALARVPRIEEVADHRPDRQHDRDDHPVEARSEHQGIMIGDHQEDNRQGEIIVVHRPLLAFFAPHGVRLFPREQRAHALVLVRNDDDEDVGHHDGADQRADLGEGAAPAENMRKAKGEGDENDVAGERKRDLVAAEGRATERFVQEPCQEQTCERDRGGSRRGEIEHRFVNQKKLRPEVVDDDEQGKAGEPGGIGLPFEPGQLIGHAGGGYQIFYHVIEAAAVYLPGIALYARGQPGSRLEAQIEMDEIERAADPGDARDDMQPPHDQVQPLRQRGVHVGFPRFRSGNKMTDPRQRLQELRRRNRP